MKSLKEFLHEKGHYQFDEEICKCIEEDTRIILKSFIKDGHVSAEKADSPITDAIIYLIKKYRLFFYDIGTIELVEYVYCSDSGLRSEGKTYTPHGATCKATRHKIESINCMADKHILDNVSYYPHRVLGSPETSKDEIKNTTITWRFK